ncbi:hypothetical protein BJX61DRAFT_546402 [Aspergillus egyptiacus]|nr:hypothetical protein BJX61DRAFT_546402 [Aspergillus egyptiacus]
MTPPQSKTKNSGSTSPGEKPFCAICQRPFIDSNALQMHRKMFKKHAQVATEKANCPTQGPSTPMPMPGVGPDTGIDGISTDLSSYRKFECTLCGRQFNSEAARRDHEQSSTKHIQKLFRYECTLCAKRFKDENSLRNHEQAAKKHKLQPKDIDPNGEHTVPGKGYECKLCGKHFEDENGLRNHKEHSKKHKRQTQPQDRPNGELTEPEKGSKCETCDRRFKDEISLRMHQRSTRHNPQSTNQTNAEGSPADATRHECKPCSKVFKSENSLHDHDMSKHRPQPKTKTREIYPPLEMFPRKENSILAPMIPFVRATEVYLSTAPTPMEIHRQHRHHKISTGRIEKTEEKKLTESINAANGTSRLSDTWSIIPCSQREAILSALRAQCHTVECLAKEHYETHVPTALDIDLARKCLNCGMVKRQVDGDSTCQFHPSKKSFPKGILRGRGPGGPKSRCINCHQHGKSPGGCITLPSHSFRPANPKLSRMAHSPSPEANPDAREAVVLDCEMVGVLPPRGTHEISEVVRLSAVDFLTGETLVNTFVEPSPGQRVISWRSKVSGVTASLLEKMKRQGRTVRGWEAARGLLWEFVNSETVLVGHSLNNDLDVLGMVHTRVVDSAIVTRDAVGRDCGRFWGLKRLAKDLLEREVQTDKSGHDCMEDAFAARELVLWCLRNPDRLMTWAEGERRIIADKKREMVGKREKSMKKKKGKGKLAIAETDLALFSDWESDVSVVSMSSFMMSETESIGFLF